LLIKQFTTFPEETLFSVTEKDDCKKELHFFLAVFADCLNALAVGAPLVPGLRIFSPLPSLMRLRLAHMLE
jgi:hypothetical protein